MTTTNDTLTAVSTVLIRVLQLDKQMILADSTRLLGGIPEFDSLAVATVVIALEEQFALTIDDDDISAEIFETVGSLAAFVEEKKRPRDTQVSGLQAGFLDSTSGQLFYIRHDVPDTEARCVVFVPPFGEEMNRSRTLIKAATKKLNESGLSCCQFDFYGTGDSAGEFADARWGGWLSNLHDVISHLRDAGFRTIDLIGIRLGAALALQYVSSGSSNIARVVFWDPVFDGRMYLDRFLRTRTMAAMMAGRSENVKELNSRLQAGDSIEVGGYLLHPELASVITAIVPPTTPVSSDTIFHWIGRDKADAVNLAALSVAKAVRVDYEPYWASAEAIAAPQLMVATAACLAEAPILR